MFDITLRFTRLDNNDGHCLVRKNSWISMLQNVEGVDSWVQAVAWAERFVRDTLTQECEVIIDGQEAWVNVAVKCRLVSISERVD